MVLVLSAHQLSALSAHAERVYPEECCGLMVGEIKPLRPDQAQSDHSLKQLALLFPLDNEWTPDTVSSLCTASIESSAEPTLTKARRYWIDPKDMLQVQKQARAQGLNIIGVYHSHPDHVAEPSECDRAQAWPEYAYVIVSVCEGKAVDVRNWTLDSTHQFQLEPIRVSPSSAKDRMPVSA